MRRLLRATLLLAAAACAGCDSQSPVVRLKLWRVTHALPAAKAVASRLAARPGSWLEPITPPATGDEQLYNFRDACVPARAAAPRASTAHTTPRAVWLSACPKWRGGAR